MRRESTSAPAVEVDSLHRNFRGQRVLSDLHLRVDPAETHGLIGPNGAGKTTLLRILAGLLSPSSGHVRIFGLPATDRTVRSSIGWVPAGDRTFYLRISGRENLLFYARLYGMRPPQARERAETLLQHVGLTGAADRPAGEYSKGMLKRLGIARALITEPKLLLFDEATHDLDPEGAESVRRMVIDSSAAGAAVLWATQRLEELPNFADTVTVLTPGGVAFSGEVDRLVATADLRSFVLRTSGELPDEAVRAVQTQLEPGTTLVLLPGHLGRRLLVELSGPEHLGRVISLLERQGVQVISCAERVPEIRSAFRQVTGA